ncbi:hypothetical protein Ait01nite_015250 [Actinoplanes italicus]|uniref:Uncharacterized protein n=1 Tax=Actinoplanes italicus TaxID=113567 RepID=A0A2T0KHN4_9ACTN|nr:hypothetical protein [Actinoplanes italicus]PRX22959.1 hypothetical protein CLV67_104487 [Actinoplanes italicus]GIE28480.1 hypothetical protein Ait01nite_015250 [Actinoplanes italicus]
MPDDTDTTGLERGYRRWLLAYPREYRRDRGPEILVTLLDAADPGRSRPAAREVAHLLRHGLSVRVAEVGRRAVVVAVIAAVLGGLGGIALGSWLAWRSVDPMTPDKATAMSLARTALPVPAQGKVEYYGRHTFWNPNSNGSLKGGTGLRAGRATVTGKVPPQGRLEELTAAVQRQMRAQGWQDVRTTIDRYGSQVSPSALAEVTGTRDGYLATVQAFSGDAVNPATLSVDLMWAEPPGHIRDTILGGLAGVLLGALLGLGTAHRMRRYGPGRQRWYSRLCVATLLMLTPACLGNIPTGTGSLLASTHRNGTGPSVYWGGFVFFGAQPLAILSLIPIVAIIVGCLWPRGENARTSRIA